MMCREMVPRVDRDFRHNRIPIQELRRNRPRSIFPQKSPFRAHFRAFYPHPAHESAPRADGLPTFWHRNAVASFDSLATVLPPPAPHRPPGPAGSGPVQTLPRWLLPATDRPIAKNRTGPISTSGSSISVCHRTRRFLRAKSICSSPTRRRSTVDHSLVARRRSTPVCPGVPAGWP